MNKCIFNNNNVTRYSLFNQLAGESLFENNTLTNNNLNQLYNLISLNKGNMTFKNNLIRDNSGYNIINLNEGSIDIENNRFHNNTNTKNDDILITNNNSNIRISNNTYTNNMLNNTIFLNDSLLIEDKEFKTSTQVLLNPIYNDSVHNGNLELYINDLFYDSYPVVNSTVNLTYNNEIDVGIYNATLKYVTTDKNYQNTTLNNTLTVKSSKPHINIKLSDELKVGKTVIYINITDAEGNGISGANFILKANDNSEIDLITDTNGFCEYNFTNSIYGANNISISYYSDEYGLVSINTTFTLQKLSSYLIVNADDVKIFNDTAISGILVDEDNNAIRNAELIVTFNDVDYVINTDDNGRFTFNNKTNLIDKNTVIISYDGSDKYENISYNITFNTIKRETSLTMNTSNINIGEVLVVNLTLFDEYDTPLTTNVTLKINDMEQIVEIINGSASYDYKSIVTGVNNISLSYSGDDYYINSNITCTFIVNQNKTLINVNPITAKVLSDCIITGSLQDVTGNYISNSTVKFVLNGEELGYNITNNEGTYSYIFKALTSGVNNLSIEYEGSSNYTSIENSIIFNVEKIGSNITVNVIDVKVGSSTTISGILTDEYNQSIANANISIRIGNESFTVKTGSEGYYNQNYTPLNEGNISINITFLGDEIYNSTASSSILQVIPLDMLLTIDSSDVKIFNNTIITGTLKFEDLTPIVNVELTVAFNGEKYNILTNDDGSYTFNNMTHITGINNISVTYSDLSANTSFNVIKRSTKLSLNTSNVKINEVIQINGKLVDEYDNPLNKTVTLTINESKINITTNEDGYYSHEYYLNTSNPINIGILFDEDDYYTTSEDNTLIKADKLKTSISLFVNDTNLGNTTTITGQLTDKTGLILKNMDITLTINNQNYDLTTDSDGKYAYDYKTENIDLNNVNVLFAGNTIYEESTNTTTFNVSKNSIEINIIPVSINSTVIILNITINSNFENNDTNITLIIYVNDDIYEVNLNKTTQFTYTPKKSGNTTVNIVFDGDEEYAKNSFEYSVNVPKSAKIEYNVTRFNISGKIVDEDDLPIENYSLNVNVNNEVKSVISNVNGSFSLSFDNIVTGNNNITITSQDNENYDLVSINDTINIEYKKSCIHVYVNDSKINDNIIITATLTDENNEFIDTNKLKIQINNEYEELMIENNNTYYYQYQTKLIGTNTITIKYDGDENHTPSNTTTSFQVEKLTTTITLNTNTPQLYNTLTIQGTLVDEKNNTITNGLINIKINDNSIAYTLTDEDGSYSYNYTVQTAGISNITVIYGGNYIYDQTKANITINTEKLNTTLSITASNTNYLNKTNITGKLTNQLKQNLQNADITVIINNNTYNTKTRNDGTFAITHQSQNIGTNNITAYYNGDTNHNKATSTTSYEIAKTGVLLTINASSTTINKSTSISGKIEDMLENPLKNQSITIMINNTPITVQSNADGLFYYNYTPTTTGLLNISVKYDGNNYYEKQENTSTLMVEKIKTNITTIINTSDINHPILLKITIDSDTPEVNGKVMITDNNNTELSSTIITNKETTIEFKLNESYTDVLFIKFDGNNIYEDKILPINITLNKLNVKIISTNITGHINQTITITSQILDETSNKVNYGLISLMLNNKTITTTNITNGTATMKITFNNTQNETYTLKYHQNNIYNTNTTKIKIDIRKLDASIEIPPITAIVNDTIILTAHIKTENNYQVNGGILQFKVNGRTLYYENGSVISLNVVNNTATLNYTVAKTWLGTNTTISAVYSGTNQINSCRSENNTMNITLRNANITSLIDDKEYTAGDYLIFKVIVTERNEKLINTGQIVVKLNGITLKNSKGSNIYINVTNGIALYKYNVPKGFIAGVYNLSIIYGGNIYERVEISSNIIIKKVKTHINLKTSITHTNSTIIRAQIYDNENTLTTGITQITIKINGITRINKQNITNGQVELKVDLPYKGGIYNLTIIAGENHVYTESKSENYLIKTA